MSDLIDRSDAIMAVKAGALSAATVYGRTDAGATALRETIKVINALPSAQPEKRTEERTETHECVYQRTETHDWIPVTERLPEDIRPVIVTWCNTDPASYYQYIVGKRFIGVAHYKSGKWYWYSSTTEDFLAEYGRYDGEEFDEAIEVLAWCEMPEPYKGEQE